MKKITVIVALCLICITTHAQEDSLLAITYKRSVTVVVDSARSYTHKEVVLDEPYPECATVGDKTSSLLFYAFPSDKIKNKDFKKEMGKKVRHHTLFYNFVKQKSWSEIKTDIGKGHLVEKPFDTIQWKLFDISKVVLGYTCKMAIGISSKNDSILVWYTQGLGNYKGKITFATAPGVVLAAETQLRGMLLKYEAINLFKYEGKLEFPVEAKIIKEN